MCSRKEYKSQVNQYLANCQHSEVGGLSLPEKEENKQVSEACFPETPQTGTDGAHKGPLS